MKQLDDYNKSLEIIYEYFGFKEDWTAYPIDDRRKYFWYIDGSDVKFYDSKEAFDKNDGMHSYSNELLNDRFYPKSVYEGKDFTMIMVDTYTDGNKFLAVYDNSKRII